MKDLYEIDPPAANAEMADDLGSGSLPELELKEGRVFVIVHHKR